MDFHPAIVVLRVPPDDKGPVRLPLWRPAYTPSEAEGHIKSIDCTLNEARAAHVHGNPAAVLIAVRLVRACRDQSLPDWLAEAVQTTLESAPSQGAGARWKQWRTDTADYLRYRAVEILRDRTAEKPDRRIFDTLADRLRDEGGEHAAYGDPRALEEGYKRVVERCPEPNAFCLHYAPRYYPDPATLHILHAADVVKATPELITLTK